MNLYPLYGLVVGILLASLFELFFGEELEEFTDL
jgi:tetrahydromethanopterin S-methyltransferase subunit G